MSSIFPYFVENCPAERAASQPPNVEHMIEDGKWPSVKPRRSSSCSRCSPRMPASTVAAPACASSSTIERMRLRSTTTPPRTGSVPPHTPEPAPNGTSGVPVRTAARTIAATSSVEVGQATASGGCGAGEPPESVMSPRGHKSRA